MAKLVLSPPVLAATFYLTNAKAALTPTPAQIKPAIIQFTNFDAVEHSYSIGFIIDCGAHDQSYSFFQSTGMHKEPVKIYDDINERFSCLGNITSPSTRNAQQVNANKQAFLLSLNDCENHHQLLKTC